MRFTTKTGLKIDATEKRSVEKFLHVARGVEKHGKSEQSKAAKDAQDAVSRLLESIGDSVSIEAGLDGPSVVYGVKGDDQQEVEKDT